MTNTSSLVRAVCLLALCAGFTACGGNNDPTPPAGNYLGLQTHQYTVYPSGVESRVGSWYIKGNLVSPIPPTVGSITATPGANVRTSTNGYYYLANAVVPANWAFEFESGVCYSDPPSIGEFHNRTLAALLCYVHANIIGLDVGFLDDGTPVYTGGDDKLVAGDTLYPGDSRTSADGSFELVYQSDGNLVLYDGSTPVWASGTAGASAGRTSMQNDGNLVVYDASNTPVWASNTGGWNGSVVVVQSDRCAKMYWYNGTGWLAATPWSTGTCY